MSLTSAYNKILVVNGKKLTLIVPSPAVYDPDLTTYISGLSTPLSDTQKTRLNTFIVNVKAGMGITNLSDAFDIMYVFANETEEAALRNLVKRNYDASLVLTPTFTAFEGYQTNGVNNYVKGLITLSTDASRYTQNSASYGFYSRKSRAFGGLKNSGVSGSGHSLLVYPLRTAAAGRVFMNSGTATGANFSTVDTYGMISTIRDASMSVYAYKNKVKGTTGAVVSTGVPSGAGVGFGGSIGTGSFDDLQFAFGYAGRALTGSDVSCLVDNFNKYLLPTYFTFPSVIMDGSTLGWYIADASSTSMTFSVDTSVSRWNDLLGSGRDLLTNPAIGASFPTWTSDGVLFDGSANVMYTIAFTFNQPNFVYIVFNQKTWTANDKIFDGMTVNYGTLQQGGTTPNLTAYAGGTVLQNPNLPVDTLGIVRVLFNGANSKYIINNGTPVTGNLGTNAMGGLTLGARTARDIQFSNILVKEIILRNSVDNATDEAAIYNYLATKYSIT